MSNKTSVALVPLNHLTESEGKFGLELGVKYPEVVDAAREFNVGADAFGSVTMRLVYAVRTAKLNDREASLLIRAQGVSKQRISFLKRQFTRVHELQQLGFRAP